MVDTLVNQPESNVTFKMLLKEPVKLSFYLTLIRPCRQAIFPKYTIINRHFPNSK